MKTRFFYDGKSLWLLLTMIFVFALVVFTCLQIWSNSSAHNGFVISATFSMIIVSLVILIIAFFKENLLLLSAVIVFTAFMRYLFGIEGVVKLIIFALIIGYIWWHQNIEPDQ